MQLGFVASVVEAAARVDLDVLLSPSGGDHDRSFERVVTGQRVDGVILMEIRLEDARVARLQQTGLPFVTIGRTAQPDAHVLGRRRLRGPHRPVRPPPGRSRPPAHRAGQPLAELVAAGLRSGHRALAGFTAAVDRRGITGVSVCCADDAAAGQACMEQLLAEHPEVTAIATINEAALRGMQRALDDAGLSVPRDFSITGVVAQHWAEDFRPPLTAADVPAHDMGARAVELLLERIADPTSAPRHVLMAPPIALRSTTGPAAARSM